MQVQYFIGTAKDSSTSHFSLNITGSRFTGLQAASFFHASKYSYADSITIIATTFTGNSAQLFSLEDETDNKGYYNVEKMTISECRFERHKGAIALIYRGGNDESTMGPKFFFNRNLISQCNSAGPLLRLHGVQHSEISNNAFRQANARAVSISYTDVVKAKHLQHNNVFEESGAVQGNKYVQ